MYEENIKVTEGFQDELQQNEWLNDVKSLLESISRLSGLSFVVVDFSEQKMIYRSKHLLFADLAFQSDIQRKSCNPYWSLIDQKDYNLMTEIEKAYKDLIHGLKGEERRQHSYITSYHIWFRKKRQVITQKFTPLKLHSDGTLRLGLFQMTISSCNKCGKAAVLGVDFKYSYDISKRKFLLCKEFMGLTLLEKAILLRAAEGLSSKQIANDLCKSINTIKTHKERLFDKLGVSSMNEALAFAQSYNLFSVG